MKFAKGNQCKALTADDIDIGMILTAIKPRTYEVTNMNIFSGEVGGVKTMEDTSFMGNLLRVKSISWPFVQVVVLTPDFTSMFSDELQTKIIDANRYHLGLVNRDFCKSVIKAESKKRRERREREEKIREVQRQKESMKYDYR